MSTSNTPDAEIISRFNSEHYVLLEKIGEGGFGQVFKAIHKNTQQQVALKLLTLKSEFNSEKRARYIERFERETLLCSRLQHPNIVRLLDKGQCGDDLIFAVFEYVDGLSLKERLQMDALPPILAADIMGQVLKALSYAHEHGVIHRDIKPANIILSPLGDSLHARILDFGIGTLVNEARQLDYKSLTLTHETLGTPSYAAPEQLRGEAPCPQTDLYVWGLVFLECLTGQTAISGSNIASIFHKQLSPNNVPIPSEIAGHPVATLLRRVLNKKTQERAANAYDVYRDLKQLNFASLAIPATHKKTPIEAQNLETCEQTFVGSSSLFSNTHLTERKQITVLCLILNIRPASDSAINAEIVDTIYRDQKSSFSDLAIRYGALEVASLGDTLLFYFGHPRVSDNDCRLATRTALEIISNLANRNAILQNIQGVISQARIGIHTGFVTVYPDLIPEGDTANIAVELAREAQQNQVLCTAPTRKILESYIEFEAVKVKKIGITQKSTSIYSIKGERQVEAFGFLRANRQAHNFIGREDELSALVKLCTQNAENDAKLAHIYGEAGIGKSRLIFELRKQLHQYTHYITQCLPEYQNNALFPVFKILQYKYALDTQTPDLAAEHIKEAIDTCQLEFPSESFALLCSWLDLPITEETAPSQWSAEKQLQILFSALSALLREEKDKQCLFIFEDLHWADNTTLEFIQFMLNEQSARAKQYCIITSRQKLPENLKNIAANEIKVDKLNQENTVEFIHKLFDQQALAPTVSELICARTDGIPLFIEELVDMLKQKKLLTRLNGVLDFIDPDVNKHIPISLRDSLQQKLDSQPYAKETAQIAATIGREFDYALLASASLYSEEQLQNHLNELENSELIFKQRKISGDIYIFKHALVRDAAYETLPSEKREQIHLRIAQNMELSIEQGKKYEISVMAKHFNEAKKFVLSSRYWNQAANLSVKQANNQQAIQQFQNALNAQHQLPQTKDFQKNEIEIRASLGIAYAATLGYASHEVEENLKKINILTENIDNPEKLFPILWATGVNHLVQAKYDSVDKIVNDLVSIADKQSDPELRFPAYLLKVGMDWQMGKFCDAQKYAEHVLKDYCYEEHNRLTTIYTYDPGIAIMCVLAVVQWSLGKKEQCYQTRQNAIALSRRNSVPSDLAHTLIRCSQTAVYDKDYQTTFNMAKEAHTLSCQHGMALWKASSTILMGWAKCGLGDKNVDLSSLDQAYEDMLNTGAKAHTSWYLSLIAESYFLNNKTMDAFDKICNAVDFAVYSGDSLYLVESHRLKLNIILANPEFAQGKEREIEEELQKMLTLSKTQNAKGFDAQIQGMLKKYEVTASMTDGKKSTYGQNSEAT